MRLHDFIFGVFCEGEAVFILSETRCSHNVAAMIVGLLDLTKQVLEPGHYFAADYKHRGGRNL